MNEDITPVVFRVYPAGDVLALFPTVDEGQYRIACYQHIGQHGAADYSVCINDTRPAAAEEYEPLKRELERIGWTLKVYRKAAHLLPWRQARRTREESHA